MTQLIRTWHELAQVPPTDKLKIVIDEDMCSGHIQPIDENEEIEFGKNYHYLSTHTFYGRNYKESTAILQECGFDIEIDNWDKEENMEELEIKEELTEEEKEVSEKAAGIVEKILDNMNNPLIRLTPEQYHQMKLEEMEKELAELPEGDYKATQLSNKIAEKRKKWFPNVIWNSSKEGTYRKPKTAEEKADEALTEEVAKEIEQALAE